jgi:DNA-binding transcriptional regulator YhcF (GntR family)
MDPALLKGRPSSGVPIYLQLMDRLRHAIESCALAPGDQLPGIRTLAQQLVISPNTVVKTYTELEREGVIELRHGAGAFVVDHERHPDRIKEIRGAKRVIRAAIEKLRKRRFAPDEIRRLVDAELRLHAEEVRGGHLKPMD